VLMRLRDTRVYCAFENKDEPVIIREINWRESPISALSTVSLLLNELVICIFVLFFYFLYSTVVQLIQSSKPNDKLKSAQVFCFILLIIFSYCTMPHILCCQNQIIS
jgi:hypothetical protein